MEDLPFALAMQQQSSRPRSGEELEAFGKSAAALHLNCGKSLTDAVVDSVKEAGLSPEQVRRVVEFANTSAYLKKFGSAGPLEKVVSFEGGPASFPDVIRDLNDGGGGSVDMPAAGPSDYSFPPPDVSKIASLNRAFCGAQDKVAEAFGGEEVSLPYSEPLNEAMEMRDKLAGLYQETVDQINELEYVYSEVREDLFNHVKQASLGGVPLGHVVAAFSSVSEEPVFMKEAFAYLTPRLIENRVFSGFEALSESLEKTAQVGVLNREHPMLDAYGGFCESLAKLAATREVQEDVLSQLDTISTFLKTAKDWVDVAEAGVQSIPKAWRAATGATAKASVPAEQIGTRLFGRGAGKAIGALTKYSPHIAAGLAGEEAYQNLKYNPIARGAGNFVMSRVPYTEQNMIRQYEIQRR